MAETLTYEIVHLRLPLRSVYLPVLRSIAGVLAGVSSLEYDQIMHLRLAVSEVFEFVRRRALLAGDHADGIDLGCSFVIGSDELEILITPSGDVSIEYSGPEDEESLALLNSLMNVVEIDTEKSMVRLVKYMPERRV